VVARFEQKGHPSYQIVRLFPYSKAKKMCGTLISNQQLTQVALIDDRAVT